MSLSNKKQGYHNCQACAFYRNIELDTGHIRRLCQLTGARLPMYGAAGCHFLAGEWSQLDAILGLPTAGVCGNLDFPNHVKPGNGFSRNGEIVAKTKFAIDDFSVNPISHIAEKLEGSLVRPGTREGQVAHMARERTRLPFFASKIPTM